MLKTLTVNSHKYLIVLAALITAASTHYFYSISMMFLTTFVLAYLSKGLRRKQSVSLKSKNLEGEEYRS